MLTDGEKNQIRSLITSPAWGSVENLKKDLIEKIRSEPKLRDTVDETALRTAFDEGQVAGIDKLFTELFKSQL